MPRIQPSPFRPSPFRPSPLAQQASDPTGSPSPCPPRAGTRTGSAALPRLRGIEDFFAALGRRHTPALVWYGPQEERVELSGRVLENWAAKSAHLLAEELDAAPGTGLWCQAEAHWRTVGLALGALRAGLVLVPLDPVPLDLMARDPMPGEPAARAAASEPWPLDQSLWCGFEDSSAAHEAATAVFLARPALATHWAGETSAWPEEAVDYCAEVRACGDHWDPWQPVAPTDPVGVLPASSGAVHNAPGDDAAAVAPDDAARAGRPWTASDWLANVLRNAQEAGGQPEGAGTGRPERPVRAVAAGPAPLDIGRLATWCGVMAAGGTVVLVGEDAAHDAPRLERILAQEGTTGLC